MPLTARTLLEQATSYLADHGINLCGLVDVAEFDRCQPRGMRARELWSDATGMLVLAVGGRAPWDARPQPGSRRVSEACRRGELAARGMVERLAALDVEAQVPPARWREKLSLVALGEMSGVGAASPVLGQLMHPAFGPYLRVCGLVLVRGVQVNVHPEAVRCHGEAPCPHCTTQACVSACPAGALDGGVLDAARCADYRHAGGCRERCAARAACDVGLDHHWGEHAEAREQASGLATMRREFGLGLWAYVPEQLRRHGAR